MIFDLHECAMYGSLEVYYMYIIHYMNKYIYKVRFVFQEQKLCININNKQFNYNFNNRKQ